MSDKKDGGYVYPQGKSLKDVSASSGGMTLRDYFAGQALIGLMSATNQDGLWMADDSEDEVSEVAYRVSDSMLKERNK